MLWVRLDHGLNTDVLLANIPGATERIGRPHGQRSNSDRGAGPSLVLRSPTRKADPAPRRPTASQVATARETGSRGEGSRPALRANRGRYGGQYRPPVVKRDHGSRLPRWAGGLRHWLRGMAATCPYGGRGHRVGRSVGSAPWLRLELCRTPGCHDSAIKSTLPVVIAAGRRPASRHIVRCVVVLDPGFDGRFGDEEAWEVVLPDTLLLQRAKEAFALPKGTTSAARVVRPLFCS